MARKKLEIYKFTPIDSAYSNRATVKFPGRIELNDLLVIINVTDGVTIYSFGDPGKGAERFQENLMAGEDADYPYAIDGTCTFALEFDGSGMDSTDELLIYYEDERRGLTVRPFDQAVDAVGRMRTGNPQSLIDADFEYGLQESKWQNLGLNRNLSSFYDYPGPAEGVTSVASDGATPFSNITVTFDGNTTGIGTPISVVGLEQPLAEGIFIPFNSNGTNTAVYKAKGVVPTSLSITPFTKIKVGNTYENSQIPFINIVGAANGDTTVTTNGKHGLCPGSPITVVDVTAGSQPHEGRFFVNRVVSGDQFIYNAGADTSSAITLGNVSIFAISDSFFTHRPFDGGVLLGTQFPIHGLEAKRQSRRYFRYQSGKGIQFTSGFLFNPVIDIQEVTFDSTDIVVETQIEHGLQKGAGVYIDGCQTDGYNGTYVVSGITSETVFKVTPESVPTTTPAVLTKEPTVGITTWAGSVIRSGMFDDLNGMFWENDGNQINVVLRTSTKQISGNVSVTSGVGTVTGSRTRFTEQLTVGQPIQIRGQRYIISSIEDDTTLNVNPRYRGTNANNVKFTALTEKRIPQSQFNFDTIDGKGPSGYKLKVFDPNIRMQMVGVSFSWYGAGYVDYMIRGPEGEWIIAHRITNNNINNEAYMRSGNLPARYELANKSATGRLAIATGINTTTLALENAEFFPTPLDPTIAPYYVKVTSNQSGVIRNEIMSYTGKSGNTLTGVTVGTGYSVYVAGQDRTFDGGTTSFDNPVGSGVELMNTTCSPTVSHWGSSVIMDGEFTEDTGFLYSLFGGTGAGSQASTSTQTVFLFRGAPSVSDTLVGELGEREVVNRAQIKLDSLQFSNNDSKNLEIFGVLNPSNVDSVGWEGASSIQAGGVGVYQPSFAQYNDTFTEVPANGELLFRFLSNSGTETFKLGQIKEIQGPILGGNNTYPDGPEVLAIVVRNNSNQTATYDFVLNWKEAQA